MAIVGILNVLIAHNSAKVHAFGIHGPLERITLPSEHLRESKPGF